MISIQHQPALPHDTIKEIFENIYLVVGTSITHHQGQDIQHSSNMTIVRHGNELSLINTVRLDERGLRELDALGRVKNVIRIGAFHGQDDAFYCDTYGAKLWALQGMKNDCGQGTSIAMDIAMAPGGPMPFPDCEIFVFETSSYPEGIIHIAQNGGILVTCDSIKNWLTTDRFFNESTAKSHQEEGKIGPADIAFWSTACNVQLSDFLRLQSLSFRHLLSAHGSPIRNDAYEQLALSIKKQFGI